MVCGRLLPRVELLGVHRTLADGRGCVDVAVPVFVGAGEKEAEGLRPAGLQRGLEGGGEEATDYVVRGGGVAGRRAPVSRTVNVEDGGMVQSRIEDSRPLETNDALQGSYHPPASEERHS